MILTRAVAIKEGRGKKACDVLASSLLARFRHAKWPILPISKHISQSSYSGDIFGLALCCVELLIVGLLRRVGASIRRLKRCNGLKREGAGATIVVLLIQPRSKRFLNAHTLFPVNKLFFDHLRHLRRRLSTSS